MTVPFTNPNTSGLFPREALEDEGISEEMLAPKVPQNIGIIIVANPQPTDLTPADHAERGLTIVIVNDERHLDCPAEPHKHDHTPLLSGRITYAKALTLAAGLIQLCLPLIPIDSTEQRIVARMTTYIEDMRAEQAEFAMTTTAGGHEYNII